MQTSLPDLPFNSRCIITADTHSTSHNDNAAHPRTDLKHFKPWKTFTTDIHTIISNAMMSTGIANGPGTNIIVGENFRVRRPRVMACEGDVHEVANTELHQAVVDVLSELGVEGRFWRPGSGGVGIIGEGDFAWLGSGSGALMHDRDPKLVVEYTTDWVADLLDLDANLQSIARGKFTVNDRRCVDALHQIYGYMTFNDHKYGILSNLRRTWFFKRDGGGGALNYAGPIDLTGATSPGSGPSVLKAFVGVVLLAEKNPFRVHALPIMDPVRFFDLDGHPKNTGNYLSPTKDGAYKCLDLDPRLCDFRRSTVRHTMRGFVVETNLPNRNVTAVCKAVDLFQNQTAITAIETESNVYLALHHLQGLCIPKVYGYFSIWGILRLLALENVGKAISESEPISSALRNKMKAAVGRIHEAGYVHGDIERRNFCVRGGRVFVIDLEYCEKTQDRMRMDDEMDAIDKL